MEVLSLGKGDSGLVCQLLALDGMLLTLAPTVKGLDVVLDAPLSMVAQITNVTSLAFFQLH